MNRREHYYSKKRKKTERYLSPITHFKDFWKINRPGMTKILELRGNILSIEEAVPPQEKIMQESERYLSPITHFKVCNDMYLPLSPVNLLTRSPVNPFTFSIFLLDIN